VTASSSTVASTITTATGAAYAGSGADNPSFQHPGGIAPSLTLQQARPGSLLTALPGESVGSLIATLSPLIIGLLVAALIYGAYSRRQDSSS
jgi:hypothetical protein